MSCFEDRKSDNDAGLLCTVINFCARLVQLQNLSDSCSQAQVSTRCDTAKGLSQNCNYCQTRGRVVKRTFCYNPEFDRSTSTEQAHYGSGYKIMRKFALTTLISLLTLQSFCLDSSQAKTPFDEGVALYGQKNYRAAAQKFEEAIAGSSRNANAIYYCAMSHQMCSNWARAKQLFEYVSTNFPNSQVAPMAVQALNQLNRTHGSSGSRQTETASAGTVSSTGTSRAAGSLAKAKAECDEIMKKADQQIEDEKAASHEMYSDGEGHSFPDISQERKREIIHEAEEKCKKIMETAERSARAYERTESSSSTAYNGQSRSGKSASKARDGSDLISVIRNQGERPPVSSSIIAQIKSSLESFPPQFLDMMRANKARVQVTPTMIDLHPDLKNTRPRGYEEGHTYKNCPAMFEYPNIVVAEYALIGDNDSSWQKLDDSVGSMRHEMGHALDAFLGNLTATEEFKHVYYLDLGKIDQQTKEHLSYYTQKGGGGPSEAFAEVFAGIYGKRSRKEEQARTDEVVKAFPGLAALIKKKISEYKP